MPFNIQLKGFLIGVAFALFVWPWITGLLSRGKTAAS